MYNKNVEYILEYLSKSGDVKKYKYTPQEDSSIVKMIAACKSNNKDFIKLLDVKESSKLNKEENVLLNKYNNFLIECKKVLTPPAYDIVSKDVNIYIKENKLSQNHLDKLIKTVNNIVKNNK